MAVEKVLVTGAGLMGSGIAQVCAQAGLRVWLHDVSRGALDRARQEIGRSVGKLAEKGRLAEPAEAVLERVSFVGDLEAGAGADLAVEAVFEDREVKREVFRRLAEVCRPEALLATNTSAIPVSELAAAASRPERVLGLHFFSPVPLMQAVEVIAGYATSPETFEAGRLFALRIGKEPILVRRDVPGFVLNRINLPSTIEAMHLVEEGVATPEDIDKGVRLALGRKMGIFETGDLVGLDVTCGALKALYEETKDPRWYPPMILRRKVAAGHLGRKAGRGWYAYDAGGNRVEE
ncbi:MAG: 3-hydroxyacyl-CoA dehydrogenase family protein [Deferrisomatales bacterium]|nr:3-hydroxyacyl-CoA dehydrogenase family protein [Deferrisomatales bacterium]